MATISPPQPGLGARFVHVTNQWRFYVCSATLARVLQKVCPMPNPRPTEAPNEHSWKTERWWLVLKGIAALNIVAWSITAAMVDTSDTMVCAHLALSAVYVTACAFRSVRPRVDLERTALVDHWTSSMVLGRSAATVAEVSFATQIALFVYQASMASGTEAFSGLFPILIVGALALAQVFCWWSVVTLSHLGHAIEESLWGVTFAAVTVALLVMIPNLTGALWWASLVAIPGCVAYVVFMFTVDVPMYVRRWRTGSGAQLGIVEGFRDARDRREVTRSWTVWQPEVAWMTGYFSCAVWSSIGLVHLAGM